MKYILITSLFAAFFAIQIPAQNYSKNTLNLSGLSPETADDQMRQVNAGFNAPVQDYGRKSNLSFYYCAGVSFLKMAYPSNNYATIQNLKNQPSIYFGLGTSIRLSREAALEFDLSGFKTKGAIENAHFGYLYYNGPARDTTSTYDQSVKIDWLNFQGAAKIRLQPVTTLPVFIGMGIGLQKQVNNLSVVTETEKEYARIEYDNGNYTLKKYSPPFVYQRVRHYEITPASASLLFSVEIIPFPRWSKKVAIECGFNWGFSEMVSLNVKQHFLNLGLKCKM